MPSSSPSSDSSPRGKSETTEDEEQRSRDVKRVSLERESESNTHRLLLLFSRDAYSIIPQKSQKRQKKTEAQKTQRAHLVIDRLGLGGRGLREEPLHQFKILYAGCLLGM